MQLDSLSSSLFFFVQPFLTTGLQIGFVQYSSKAFRGFVDTRSVYSSWDGAAVEMKEISNNTERVIGNGEMLLNVIRI